jgi:serine/threonine-protein kinase
MSPEQIRSARSADARSDIWSLGVILYELLTGRPPFDGEGPSGVIAAITADDARPPKALRSELPRALSDAILKALQKNPAERFQTVSDFADAIRPFGPVGAWTPPSVLANAPSNPRLSIPDAPTMCADAVTDTEPAPPMVPPADTTGARPRSIVKPLLLLGAAAIAATVIFIVTMGSTPTPEPVRTEVAPIAPRDPAPPATTTVAEPAVQPTAVATPAAPPPTAPPLPKASRTARSKPGASSPTKVEPKKTEPVVEPKPPPPPEPENPLHL